MSIKNPFSMLNIIMAILIILALIILINCYVDYTHLKHQICIEGK